MSVPPRPERGFTLVELLVVVAMFSIFAAMGAHAVAGGTRAQSTANLARGIHLGLIAARTDAITDGFQRRYTCSATKCWEEMASAAGMAAQASWSYVGTNTDAGRQSTVWALDGTTDVTTMAPAGPLAGNASITFFPDGTATPGTVFVTDDNRARRYKVYVFGATGMARMVDQW